MIDALVFLVVGLVVGFYAGAAVVLWLTFNFCETYINAWTDSRSSKPSPPPEV